MVEVNKNRAQQIILGLVALTIFLQSFGLTKSPWVHRPALVLYSMAALYLLYQVFVTKDLSVLGFFAYLFLLIVFTVQYMGFIGELPGNEYLLLSAIFTGLTLGILMVARVINFK